MSIKTAFTKFKTFVDVYKMWIFFIALFSTNGMQAYFNSDEEIKPEPEVKVAEVIKTKVTKDKVKAPIIKYRCNLNNVNKKLDILLTKECNCTGKVEEHEKEHHGGR